MGSKNLLELKTDPGKGKLTAKALPKQGRRKVKKRKVEDKHLKIPISRISGGERENSRLFYSGTLSFGLYAKDPFSFGSLLSLDE
jgi:hypothetical protein